MLVTGNYDTTVPSVIKVENNITIPTMKNGTGRPSKYNFIETLEVGQSFAINGDTPHFKAKTVGSSCYTVAQRIRKTTNPEFKVTVRTIEGTAKKPTLVRCWRVA